MPSISNHENNYNANISGLHKMPLASRNTLLIYMFRDLVDDKEWDLGMKLLCLIKRDRYEVKQMIIEVK